jgi:hypothetical protein
LEKNQVFGEMAFVEDSWVPDPREELNVSASVIVDSDEAEFYKIDRGFLFSLFASDKDLFARFYYVICYVLAERAAELPLVIKGDKVKEHKPYYPPHLPHQERLKALEVCDNKWRF